MHAALFKGAVQLILITKKQGYLYSNGNTLWCYLEVSHNLSKYSMFLSIMAIMLLASYMEGENTVN